MENESSQPIPTIARQVGCSPDVARDAVRVLEEWNVLHRTPARGPKGENIWLLKTLQKVAPETPYKPKKGRKTTPHKKNQGSEKNHGEKNQAYQPELDKPVSSDKSSDTSSSDSGESSSPGGHAENHGQQVAEEKMPSKESIAKEFSDEFLRVTGISNLGWSRSTFFAFANRLSANPDLTLDEFSRCSESLWSEDFWKGKLTPFNVLDKYPAWAVANRPPEVLPPTPPTDWDLFNQQETERLMSMFGGSDD